MGAWKVALALPERMTFAPLLLVMGAKKSLTPADRVMRPLLMMWVPVNVPRPAMAPSTLLFKLPVNWMAPPSKLILPELWWLAPAKWRVLPCSARTSPEAALARMALIRPSPRRRALLLRVVAVRRAVAPARMISPALLSSLERKAPPARFNVEPARRVALAKVVMEELAGMVTRSARGWPAPMDRLLVTCIVPRRKLMRPAPFNIWAERAPPSR